MDQLEVAFYGMLIILSFFFIAAIIAYGAWIRRKSIGVSPYTGMPLRRASDLPYESARKILQYLYDMHEYDNRIFDIKRASVCRETCRVFPDSITWFDSIHVDWTFLQKRYPGNYVSWGSLSDFQQEMIRESHHSLSGFQTKLSCKNPAPSEVELKYIYAKPGPLYVDINTKVLLGWKVVPDTEFEVLIVQKPKAVYKIKPIEWDKG